MITHQVLTKKMKDAYWVVFIVIYTETFQILCKQYHTIKSK